MLNSIFGKTLYERRKGTIAWTVAVFVSTFLTMLFFPPLRDAFGQALQDVPESMRSFLGSAEDYKTLTGFVDLQVIAQMVFLTLIMGIIAGTSLLAGEESNGTLLTLLAQPVRRSSAYWQKLAALAVMVAAVSLAMYLGILAGVIVLGEQISAWRLAQAIGMVWLITFFFAVLAYALGAISGKRSLAGTVAGFLAFAGYIVNSLAATSSVVEKINYLSPFRYFNTPSVLRSGLSLRNIAILAGIGSLCLLAGHLVFKRRDIYQK